VRKGSNANGYFLTEMRCAFCGSFNRHTSDELIRVPRRVRAKTILLAFFLRSCSAREFDHYADEGEAYAKSHWNGLELRSASIESQG